MKQKQKVDMIIDTILIVIGIVMLILPTFGVTNIKNLFFTIMILYAILNFIQLPANRKIMRVSTRQLLVLVLPL